MLWHLICYWGICLGDLPGGFAWRSTKGEVTKRSGCQLVADTNCGVFQISIPPGCPFVGLGRCQARNGYDVNGAESLGRLSKLSGLVSSKLRMGESSKIELTHPMIMASSAGTLRRCVKHIAEGGRSERDLRDERGGPFDPGNCPGAGRVPQHGAPVPEIA